MTQGSAILIGSIVYIAVGVLACAGFYGYVGRKTKNPHEVAENR
jgi:V-type H+-transporting ATPase subunit e